MNGPPITHGGDIGAAQALARSYGVDPGNASEWLDLSTGINPNPYPAPPLPDDLWKRLPAHDGVNTLLEAARAYYDVPTPASLVASPGTALLIQLLPSILSHRSVAILSPTYGDYEEAWSRADAEVSCVTDLQDVDRADCVVITNPNNPDGRMISFEQLEKTAASLKQRGGFLVIDEAFQDVSNTQSAVALCAAYPVIVLKSFGKFFGLAGLRLGFAIGPAEQINTLDAMLGSWAVSGPALAIGTRALKDREWQAATRAKLETLSKELADDLQGTACRVIGQTPLFTLIEHGSAERLFKSLIVAKIYVRRFSYEPRWFRIGTPGSAKDRARLISAIVAA